ncbi:hypothetical protein D3C72_1721540 [compost metagenome]
MGHGSSHGVDAIGVGQNDVAALHHVHVTLAHCQSVFTVVGIQFTGGGEHRQIGNRTTVTGNGDNGALGFSLLSHEKEFLFKVVRYVGANIAPHKLANTTQISTRELPDAGTRLGWTGCSGQSRWSAEYRCRQWSAGRWGPDAVAERSTSQRWNRSGW